MPLAQEVEDAASGALLELFPIWINTPLVDHRRVLRPAGQGRYSIVIEPYRGSSTWMSFHNQLQSSAALERLKHAIARFQPELGGYLVLSGSSQHLGDCTSLISTWCRALELKPHASEDPAAAIKSLLCDVSELLDKPKLRNRSTTILSGLTLPAQDFNASLFNGATLRSLSADELASISSHDITFGHDHDIMSHTVSTCIEIDTEATFLLSPTPPQELVVSTAEEEARQHVKDFIRALHIHKTGRAGVFLSTAKLAPELLPWLDGGLSYPLYRPPFASLELSHGDVPQVIALLQSLQAGVRDEVRIASDRLVDAESRLSPVDSLMDAVIGIEALLNPMDTAELAFRVALNYAYLAPPELRRERYDRVRSIQKTRNRVVHGGLNIKSSDARLIHEHAALAKACLRDCLKSFLLDPALTGNRRLDADFWLDRVLPANIVASNGPIENSQ